MGGLEQRMLEAIWIRCFPHRLMMRSSRSFSIIGFKLGKPTDQLEKFATPDPMMGVSLIPMKCFYNAFLLKSIVPLHRRSDPIRFEPVEKHLSRGTTITIFHHVG
jgi:hypothetical protein